MPSCFHMLNVDTQGLSFYLQILKLKECLSSKLLLGNVGKIIPFCFELKLYTVYHLKSN